MSSSPGILVVDNHDSFVHTLVGYLHELGAETDLVEADAIRADAAASVIAEASGATVDHAPELMHGMTSLVDHDGSALYAGLPDPFTATRYHSLAIVPETLPEQLVVTSRTDSGVIMGIAHRSAPIIGVQFHPEAVLTEGGHRLLGNWLESVGYTDAAARGAALHPRR